MGKKKGSVSVEFKAETAKFSQNIDNAKKADSALRAEMKLAQAQFANTGNEAEFMAKKHEILEGRLEANQQKQEALSAKLEVAKKLYGEDSDEVRRLTNTITYAAADAEKFKAQLNALNEETNSNKRSIEEYTKRVGEADSELAQLDAEMKLAEAQFKVTGNETEYLAKKHELLEKQVETNKQKQEALIKKLDAAKQAYGDNSTEAKQLERQLTNVRTELVNLNNDLENHGQNLEDAGEKAKEAGDGYTVMKDAMAGLITDGIQTASGALKDMAIDSSAATAKLAASTGATADVMEDYKKVMQEIYTDNFGESMSDIADKMAKVKEITGEVDPSKLKMLTENAITLEDTFDMDMGETLRGVDALMTHFGISAEEAFDLMASGAQQGLNYTDELGDNVAEYSGKFSEAGYTAEQYFQILQNGSEGGSYNLDKVNDAINEVTTRLADGTIEDSLASFSKDTQIAFNQWKAGRATQSDVIEQIVSDITDCTNKQEKMNLAASAFGTMAEDGGTEFIESISKVGDSFTNVKGKMDEVSNVRYGDLESSISGLGRSVQQEVLQPILDDAAPKIQEVIDSVATSLPNIVNTLQQMQPVITVIAAIIGVLTTAMALQSAVTAVKTAMEAAETTTLWGLVAAQTAALAPYLLIAVAIAAVIAIIVLCVKYWDEIKQKVIEVAQILKEKMAAAWESVKESVSNGIAKVKGFFVNILNWIKSNWQGLLLLLVNPFAGAFKLLYDNCSGFREFIDNFMDKIHSTISNIGSKIKKTASNIFSKVKEAITHPIETAKETISNLAEKIKGIFEKLKIKLPDIKLPHFKISGGEAPWGIAGKGTKPTVDVEWYRAGAVLKRATQFGTSPSGTPMVGGEAGYEAIAPIDVLQGYVAEAVEAAGGTGQIDYDLLGEATAKACARMNITINLNGREIGRLERRPV